MGQTISFRVLTHDKFISKSASEVPDHFTNKFQGRWEWFSRLLDSPYDYVKDCGCGEKCSYGCPGDSLIRPTDFKAFRERLGSMLEPNEDGESIFQEITDWLEQHPNVYVEYS